MRRKILCLFLGLTLAGASLAWGQQGREFGGGGFQDRFLQAKRSQLGPALGVNQQTVDKLLAIDARYKQLRSQMIMAMMNDWRLLEQAMAKPSTSEQEIKTILSSLRQRKEEMQNLQQRQGDEEIAILTPVQQARYLIYQRSLLKEARTIKSGGGRPGFQGRPGVGAGVGVGGGGAGGPGGIGVPTLRPTEIPVSRPSQ